MGAGPNTAPAPNYRPSGVRAEMSTVLPQPTSRESDEDDQPVYNDAVIHIATKNGSGSQSANLILLRAVCRMGIPVSGKNLFPSNIAGLPTWFTIRANEDGWLARRGRSDILVAMNDSTVAADLGELEPGATVVISDALKKLVTRTDLRMHEVPFNKLAAEACPDHKLRKRVINVIYVGVLAWLLDIDTESVAEAISHQFGGKKAAVALNKAAADAGYEWAKNHLPKHPNLRMRPSHKTQDKVIIEGNEATAIGLLFGGTTVLAWYPITPSSSVCETLIDLLDKHRVDPATGKATYAAVQAEDELASIGFVLGAGWAGARAVTATSGPGVSLMAEMAGLSYFAEIPAVIVDVQRMGPSTGLPTRTNQGDIAKAYQLSHGDCKHVLLIPGTVVECYEFAIKALDLAEHLQTLVFLMTDLDLGMNKWLSPSFTPPAEGAIPRGKVLDAAALEKIAKFERYRDVDGDGIPYRTLPGTDNPKAAYFTRGTGHKPDAEYSENAQNWQQNMDRLARKFETARKLTPAPVIDHVQGARVGLIAYGSSDMAVGEARHILGVRHETPTSYLRIRALPTNPVLRDFIARYDRIYLVEQNRDAQMAGILKVEYPELAAKIKSILHYNGLPIDAQTIVDGVAGHAERK
jgi:2-oxoglutarate ferredoxin oxidoreductase subunit alpha